MNKKYKYCFEEGRLVVFDAHNAKSTENNEKSVKISEVVIEENKVKILTNTGYIYKEANEMFLSLPSDLISLNLTGEKYAEMIMIMEKILLQTKNICMLLGDKKEEFSKNLETANDFVLNKINEINTLRKVKNIVKSNHLFVEPEETAVGIKWKTPKVNKDTNIPDHKLIQATFQYVSVLKTLKAVFSDKAFRNYYIKYNREEKHKCKQGVYRDFCCGSTHKSNEVFNDSLSLQLQLGIDDFEVCCPLKSKYTCKSAICPLNTNQNLTIYIYLLCVLQLT